MFIGNARSSALDQKIVEIAADRGTVELAHQVIALVRWAHGGAS